MQITWYENKKLNHVDFQFSLFIHAKVLVYLTGMSHSMEPDNKGVIFIIIV